jgi:prepilin peptidase CpaA
MLTTTQALIYLPFVLPIAIWVAWSDLKFMRIPNKAVIAMGVVALVIGLLVFPFQTWLWSLALLAIIFVIGFVLNAAGLIGGGDAKFAAAMAPLFVTADLRFFYMLSAACLLGAFIAHRGVRMIPAVRAAAPDWTSWGHKQFPMGLTLAGMLLFYLVIPLVWG